jgi:hypothetical protein
MTNLEDLGRKSITDMSDDEAFELIKQIRLSRRISKINRKKKPKKQKTPMLSTEQARKVLEILEPPVHGEFPNAHLIVDYVKTEKEWNVLCARLDWEIWNKGQLKRYVRGLDPIQPQVKWMFDRAFVEFYCFR